MVLSTSADNCEKLLQDKYENLLSKVKSDIKSISASIKSLGEEKAKMQEKLRKSEKLLEDEKENDTTETHEYLRQKVEQEKRLLAEMSRLLMKFELSKRKLVKLRKDIRKRFSEPAALSPLPLPSILKQES